MSHCPESRGITRREVCKATAGGAILSCLGPLARPAEAAPPSDLFSVHRIPKKPFRRRLLGANRHVGVECLLHLMGDRGLDFYRSSQVGPLTGPDGLIAANDVVLVKVNAQWKYRGCTNSDVVRGVIQSVLDHPDGFTGEVVIIENGQGFGSLNCDAITRYPDTTVHANARKRHHTFTYLVESIFRDSRVSAYLLDPIRWQFIAGDDHSTDGYRTFEDVSYPCFTTARGNRVELQQGIWNRGGYSDNLKLINIPVLKHHDGLGSYMTASLKHMYGILSMEDGLREFRHFSGLGRTCGKMMVSVKTPVLNILDAIWVSHQSLRGYPADTTTRVNRIVASQDPVALDSWAARHVLYPIDRNEQHHPEFPAIASWLDDARRLINQRGGLRDPAQGIRVRRVTSQEDRIRVSSLSARRFLELVQEVA